MKEFVEKWNLENQELLKKATERGVPITDDPTNDLMAYDAKRRETGDSISNEVSDTMVRDTTSATTDKTVGIDSKLFQKLVRFVDKIIK